MAQPARDPLIDLELHRQRLEENLEKFRQSLKYWQTWEVEYEGLKEEIQNLPHDTAAQALNDVAKDFEGDLLTEAEIKQLIAYAPTTGLPTRSPAQVVDLLSRRSEYVQRNIESIQSQISNIVRKIEGISVISGPEAHDEDGLPITEIYEELDDDGNVISSRTSHPDEAKPQILEALKAVGMRKDDLPASQDSPEPSVIQEKTSSSRIATETNGEVHSEQDNQQPKPQGRPKKKTVSFAEELTGSPTTKIDESTAASVQQLKSEYASDTKPQIPRATMKSNDRILELDEDDKIIGVVPNTSVNESPEDAALRRQMQAYSMAEVGNIVAHMDIEDPDEVDTGSLELSSDSDEDMEEEDFHGMNVDGSMTPEYIQEMLNLEKKLNANMIQNVGPHTSVLSEDSTELDLGKVAAQQEPQQNSLAEDLGERAAARTKGDKSVRFANKLDVSSAPVQATGSDEGLGPQSKPSMAAHSTTERDSSMPTQAEPPKRVSRFRQSRQTAEGSSASLSKADPPGPQPANKSTVHTDVIERSSRPSGTAIDEFDPNSLQQQVKTEYYRQRNRMIQKQGGFKRDQIAEIDDGADEDIADSNRPNKKVSLFKAARVQGGGTW